TILMTPFPSKPLVELDGRPVLWVNGQTDLLEATRQCSLLDFLHFSRNRGLASNQGRVIVRKIKNIRFWRMNPESAPQKVPAKQKPTIRPSCFAAMQRASCGPVSCHE